MDKQNEQQQHDNQAPTVADPPAGEKSTPEGGTYGDGSTYGDGGVYGSPDALPPAPPRIWGDGSHWGDGGTFE